MGTPATLDDVVEGLRAIYREIRHLRLLQEASLSDAIAPADDMDDPQIRFDPKSWRGPTFKGERMSACPPAYLDHLARALMAMARNEQAEGKLYKGKPSYVYKVADAARARRWALRRRTGWTPPPPPKEEPTAPTANPFGGGGLASTGGGLSGGARGITGGGGIGAPKPDKPIADDDFPFGANASPDDSEPDFEDEEDDDSPL